jgi:hypothetical protein
MVDRTVNRASVLGEVNCRPSSARCTCTVIGDGTRLGQPLRRAVVVGLGGASGRGPSGSGMARDPYAGRGPWALSHPICHRPWQAEQTPARGASRRPIDKIRLSVAPRAGPAPPQCGSTADGRA